MTEPVPEESRRASLKGIRVLVVDDNPVNLKVALAQLRKLGAEAVGASSGPEAVRLAGESRFSLVLMDLQMPSVDGLEATARLRGTAGCSDLPVIILTACSQEEDRSRCRAAGIDEYLVKPVGVDALREAILRSLK